MDMQSKQAHPPALAVTNARVIDGNGNVFNEPQTIMIRDGVVQSMDARRPPPEIQTLDVSGSTVLPGLIDAHVHLQSVPGSAFRQDPDHKLDAYRFSQLRSYLACGVTSVLDNAISPRFLRTIQNHLDDGVPGPQVFALAPAFYPPGGYLDHGMLTPYWGPHWRPAGNTKDMEALFLEYEGLENIVGLKVLMESGFGKAKIWPLHSEEMRRLIVDFSSEKKLPIYMHAYKEHEQRLGLDMGVHCFVHSGFIFKQPTDKFIQRAKELGTYVTTTLSSTFDQMLVQFAPDRLDDPLLELTVPEELLRTAKDPAAWEFYYDSFFSLTAPKWLPRGILRAIVKMVNVRKQITSCLESATRAIVSMHEAGIPIVVGTDASSWPVFPSFFHGSSTIREMGLLVDAGLPAMDVIASATRIPAEMMGMSNRIGTIEEGKQADLVVVRGDPLADIRALRAPSWTIRNGEAKTPSQWMQADAP